MKEEVEFRWLLNLRINKTLRNNSFLKSPQGGFKNDFEKICGVSEKHREFRKWLSHLIDEGILEFFKVIKGRGGSSDTFVINVKLLDKKLISHPMYDSITKLMDEKYLIRTAK